MKKTSFRTRIMVIVAGADSAVSISDASRSDSSEWYNHVSARVSLSLLPGTDSDDSLLTRRDPTHPIDGPNLQQTIGQSPAINNYQRKYQIEVLSV